MVLYPPLGSHPNGSILIRGQPAWLRVRISRYTIRQHRANCIGDPTQLPSNNRHYLSRHMELELNLELEQDQSKSKKGCEEIKQTQGERAWLVIESTIKLEMLKREKSPKDIDFNYSQVYARALFIFNFLNC